MVTFVINAFIDVKAVSMVAISKGTAMAISFPVTSLCSTLKRSVSCFFGVFMQPCHQVFKKVYTVGKHAVSDHEYIMMSHYFV